MTIDIEAVKKRIGDAHHWALRRRPNCATCIGVSNVPRESSAIVLVVEQSKKDIESLLSEVAHLTTKAQDNYTVAFDAIGHGLATQSKLDKALAELDELRTRHSRIVDSTDTFVAALVDERFKKDHAAMMAQLSALGEQHRRDDAIIAELRDECRQHLARINQLESADVERIAALTKQCEELKDVRDSILSDRNKAREKLGFKHGSLADCVRDVHKALGLPDSVNVIDGAKLIIEARDNALARIDVLESENVTLREDNTRVIARGRPVPMMLHCPMCHMRHIDAGEFAIKPHHTHACQSCGTVWRPAIVATVGVQFLPGFKNDTTLPANESTGQDVAKGQAPDKPRPLTDRNTWEEDAPDHLQQ